MIFLLTLLFNSMLPSIGIARVTHDLESLYFSEISREMYYIYIYNSNAFGLVGLIYPTLYFNQLLMGMTHVNAADHVLHIVVGAVAALVDFFVHDYSTTRAIRTV